MIRPLNLVDVADAVDHDEQAAGLVDVEQRSGFLLVGLQALGDGLRSVVSAALLGGALLHTLQQHVAGGFEGHHVVERSVEVGEKASRRER